MIVWKPKSPDETVAYDIDWSDQIGDDLIASYTFTRTSGDAVIEKEIRATATITPYISGGTDATTSEFLCTITTSSGQVLERAFSLYVSSDYTSFLPTVTTKRQLVDAMFNEVALNGWELDVTPEEKDTALSRLDSLMWELLGRGIDLSYNFPAEIGGGNLADALGCPNQAFNGLAVLGAKKIAPTMGKKLSQESREALEDAMKAVRAAANGFVKSARIPSGTPLGSGFKPWTTHYPFAS